MQARRLVLIVLFPIVTFPEGPLLLWEAQEGATEAEEVEIDPLPEGLEITEEEVETHLHLIVLMLEEGCLTDHLRRDRLEDREDLVDLVDLEDLEEEVGHLSLTDNGTNSFRCLPR